jgi:hypothetical protein
MNTEAIRSKMKLVLGAAVGAVAFYGLFKIAGDEKGLVLPGELQPLVMLALALGVGVWLFYTGMKGLHTAAPPTAVNTSLSEECGVWVQAGVIAKKNGNEAAVGAAVAGFTATLKGAK